MFRKNKYSDLTDGCLWQKIILLSLPLIITNIMQNCYNLADTFWLGKLENASNCVAVTGISFPISFFISSFGLGFVASGNALVSQFKGANDINSIQILASQFLSILIFFAVLFVVISFFFVDDILTLMNTPKEIYDDAVIYIEITLYSMVFLMIFLTFQSFVQGLGDTVSPMIIQFTSVGLNIILDPFLIFGWMGFPEMGIKGAAISTLISRGIAAILSCYFLFYKYPFLLPSKERLKFDSKMIRKILLISIPASISQAMSSFGFVFLQGFINNFGAVIISVQSVGNRLVNFYLVPAIGISKVLATVVGQNIGANKIKRALQGVRISMIYVISILAVGSLALFLWGDHIMSIFIDDPKVVKIGVEMFKISSISVIIYGIMTVFMGVFEGSGHTISSMTFSIFRLWGIRIPLVFLLSGYFINKFDFLSLNNILVYIGSFLKEEPYAALWWSMIASNIVASTWAWIIYRRGKWKTSKIFS